MAKKTVRDLDVAGKKVIVRCDFNVPRKDGVITNDNRIIQALPTIKYLLENNAKVILMTSAIPAEPAPAEAGAGPLLAQHSLTQPPGVRRLFYLSFCKLYLIFCIVYAILRVQ